MVPVIMTMAVLYIWTAGGSKPPSATDIAVFFEDKNEWLTTLETNWSRIGLGLPLSPQIRCAAEAFYAVCASRLSCVSATIVSSHASRALSVVVTHASWRRRACLSASAGLSARDACEETMVALTHESLLAQTT